MSNRHPSAAVGAVVAVAFPREWLHNHFPGIRDVKMQIDSRDRRSPLLRVAASSNIAPKRTRHKAARRLTLTLRRQRRSRWFV